MRCVVVLKRRFRGGGTQTAKPSAVRSQRLCLRPPKPYRAPNPSHGIGMVVELAVKQGDDASPSSLVASQRDAQSDKETIAPAWARCCDLSATLKKNYMFAGWNY
jgi:hypothetical protein